MNPGRMIELVQALGYIEIGRKTDFYHTARSLLVHCREDIPLFDEAFEAFWREPADSWTTLDLRVLGDRKRRRRPLFAAPPLRQSSTVTPQTEDDRSSTDEPPVVQVTLTYSAREVLRRKDFTTLTGEELDAIEQLIATLDWQLESTAASLGNILGPTLVGLFNPYLDAREIFLAATGMVCMSLLFLFLVQFQPRSIGARPYEMTEEVIVDPGTVQ